LLIAFLEHADNKPVLVGIGIAVTPENPIVGVIVPTMGDRIGFLKDCLASIARQGGVYVVLVSPRPIAEVEGLYQKWISDPGIGLSTAINLGEASLPNSVRYFSWLGDDDLLTDNSISLAASRLDKHPAAPFAFGRLEYIDIDGKVFWENIPGPAAVKLAHIGPNRIPQPGSLLRRWSFIAVQGVDEALRFAMDLDLFLKLQRLGKPVYVDFVLAKYRWHSESLSSGQSEKSLRESSSVRLRHAPRGLRGLIFIWEKIHVFIASQVKSRLDSLSETK
jgi:hypothetical protein